MKPSLGMNIGSQTAMMAVAMASSASFTGPISHPANILVMGPGGYRFADYLKLGIPLTVVTFVLAMALLPVFRPATPAVVPQAPGDPWATVDRPSAAPCPARPFRYLPDLSARSRTSGRSVHRVARASAAFSTLRRH